MYCMCLKYFSKGLDQLRTFKTYTESLFFILRIDYCLKLVA